MKKRDWSELNKLREQIDPPKNPKKELADEAREHLRSAMKLLHLIDDDDTEIMLKIVGGGAVYNMQFFDDTRIEVSIKRVTIEEF